MDGKLNSIAEVEQKAFTEVLKQQQVIREMVEKALVNEPGASTLMKRFDETNSKIDIMAKELGEGLDKSFTTVKTDITGIKNQVDTIFQGLGINNKEINNINTQIAATKTSIDNFDNNVKLLNQKIDQLKNVKDPDQVAALTKEIERLQTQVLGETAKFERTEELVKQWKAAHDTIKENATKNSELLNSEINTLKIKLANSITNTEILSTQLQQEKIKVEQLEAQRLADSIRSAENESASGLPPGFNKESLEALQFSANVAGEQAKQLAGQVQGFQNGDNIINLFNQAITALRNLQGNNRALTRLVRKEGLLRHFDIIATQTSQIQSLLNPPKVEKIKKRALESVEEVTKKQRGGDTEFTSIPTLSEPEDVVIQDIQEEEEDIDSAEFFQDQIENLSIVEARIERLKNVLENEPLDQKNRFFILGQLRAAKRAKDALNQDIDSFLERNPDRLSPEDRNLLELRNDRNKQIQELTTEIRRVTLKLNNKNKLLPGEEDELSKKKEQLKQERKQAKEELKEILPASKKEKRKVKEEFEEAFLADVQRRALKNIVKRQIQAAAATPFSADQTQTTIPFSINQDQTQPTVPFSFEEDTEFERQKRLAVSQRQAAKVSGQKTKKILTGKK